MPDLFDNIFSRVHAKFNGGHTKPRYDGGSQVNSGKFYSYHSTPNNNNYWLPRNAVKEEQMRKGSVSSEQGDMTMMGGGAVSGSLDSADDKQPFVGQKVGAFDKDSMPIVDDSQLSRSRFNSVASEE